MFHVYKHFLVLLVFYFALVSVLPVDMAQAGLGSIIRKAARKADDGGGAISHKLDVDGLKHFDVEPGTSRFGLATNPDGSINVKSIDGKELHIRSADDLQGTLIRFQKRLKKTGGGKALFFVSQNDLFRSSKSTSLLAKIDGLHVITGSKTSLPVSRILDQKGADTWGVEIRKGMIAASHNAHDLSEALFRMNHTFNPADVHVVSFSKKAPDFPDPINFAASGRVPDPTLIDPTRLDRAFKVLRGKKLIVTGKVEGGVLFVKTRGGTVKRLPLDDLRTKAREANIDLIILGGKSTAQPGKKSFFGRQDGKKLSAAFATERYGDFLVALGGKKKLMVMQLDAVDESHVVWRSMPDSAKASKGLLKRMEKEPVASSLARALVNPVGKAAPKEDEDELSIELNAKSKGWQTELEHRIIPGIPFGLQLLYIVNLIAGLLAWTTSSWLWEKIWRSKGRSEFSSKWSWFGYRLVRNLTMILTLMGAIGILLFLFQWLISAWLTLLAVLRIITWPVRKLFGLFAVG
ncbi:MAG: hypothetical protein GY927_01400 [bacterium]|nr:hypothetical protein [bacterium]